MQHINENIYFILLQYKVINYKIIIKMFKCIKYFLKPVKSFKLGIL